MSRILVWQWGRYGAGPRFALNLAEAIGSVPGQSVVLSLSGRAEILKSEAASPVSLSLVETYGSFAGLLWRVLCGPGLVRMLVRKLSVWKPDFAICAMTGPLDFLMQIALRRAGVPYVVVVHDAVAHPGDGFPFQLMLQRLLLRRADVLVALSAHVAGQLRRQVALRGRDVLMSSHPPFDYSSGSDGIFPWGGRRRPGPVRLLMFGRLLAYKGLDLLLEALVLLPPGLEFECRIVGRGPESATLRSLATLPHVRVENRWVPEKEVGALIGWADVMLLPYREASQSGVGATALAAGRWVLSTNVGGLAEQFRDAPQSYLCDPTARAFSAVLERLIAAQPLQLVVPDGRGSDEWRAVAARLVAGIEGALGVVRDEVELLDRMAGSADLIEGGVVGVGYSAPEPGREIIPEVVKTDL
ncbi:glycosyltransferase [Acetobacter fallax]|uniref:Glycosyltransferase n=1 Tax=Acetobacter fallax TaxID=1737473 RepID=A0ABX0KA61_9PROT|nr:glycosyltransferase [Acetobacter fallax]NHO31410.1 glycosyltransferase [Acetobacter fallax]NHO35008.1 glycosyltransferase [Acetobacter fallax]